MVPAEERMRVIVSQKGAREHFLVARALHARGVLAGLITDWYPPRSLRRPCVAQLVTSLLGKRGRAALGNKAEGIPDELVHSFRFRSLIWKWRSARSAFKAEVLYEALTETDAAFARAVASLKLPSHNVFFGYAYASLEVLKASRRGNVFTVLDQIDPGPAEFRLVAEEMTRHPELGVPSRFPKFYYDRVRREWELADVILVNSEWSRQAVTSEGADPEKIELLPLAYEPARPALTPCNRSTNEQLKVLWLGQANVRKGIYYLIEAARILLKERVEFTVAGPFGIPKVTRAQSPPNIRWLGPISRCQATELYCSADIFVLPTLSDGFAITQLEAMAQGLPVITTLNCGRVVENGCTGFIVPPRDAQALATAIRRFLNKRELVNEMSRHCIEASKRYSIEAYGRGLTNIIEAHMERRISDTKQAKCVLP